MTSQFASISMICNNLASSPPPEVSRSIGPIPCATQCYPRLQHPEVSGNLPHPWAMCRTIDLLLIISDPGGRCGSTFSQEPPPPSEAYRGLVPTPPPSACTRCGGRAFGAMRSSTHMLLQPSRQPPSPRTSSAPDAPPPGPRPAPSTATSSSGSSATTAATARRSSVGVCTGPCRPAPGPVLACEDGALKAPDILGGSDRPLKVPERNQLF